MKKNSFSWGTGIVLSLSAFVVFVGVLVWLTTRERVDLVLEDYYEAEADYPELKRKRENTLRLGTEVLVMQESGNVRIQLPSDLTGEVRSGSIHFYAPMDARLDRTFSWKPDASGAQYISLSELPRGRFQVKMETEDGGGYYFESEIYL